MFAALGLAAYLVFVNLAAVTLFYIDKLAAAERSWRVPEQALLIIALIGGSIGSIFAQQYFRHKTRKEPFRTALFSVAGIQAALLIFLCSKAVT